MSKAADDFEDALIEFLSAVSEVPGGNSVKTLGHAVQIAPPGSPVHALSVRSYRCNGCRRLGLIRDVFLNFGTGSAECPNAPVARWSLSRRDVRER